MKKSEYICTQKSSTYKMLNEFCKYLSSSSDYSIKSKEANVVSFEYKGLNYLFAYDNDDPYYIRLMLPNVISVTDSRISDNLNNIINDYNLKFKAIKVTVVSDSLWLSIEQFIYSKDNITNLFSRIILILETVISKFREDYLQKN